MCGISGFFSFEDSCKLADFYQAHLKLAHRGPDDEGFFVLTEDRKFQHFSGDDTIADLKHLPHINTQVHSHLILGHRRLSILDLTAAGHQPYQFKSYTMVYNGEIFNYLELKEELVNLGYSFGSDSDTEVVIKAYDMWGQDCFNRFNGMWAIAIYCSETEKLILCRDRFGIKPLYYSFDDNKLVFASEIKFIKQLTGTARVNPQAVYDYLRYSYSCHRDSTFFDGIFEVLPGTFLEVASGKLNKSRYWDLSNFDERPENGHIADLLCHSIQLRLRSDVKVGSLLSGGLDSSLITGIVAKKFPDQIVSTYSAIQTNREMDTEYPYLQAMLQYTGLSNEEIELASDLSDIDDLIYTIEQPLRQFSEFGLFGLYREISQSSDVKVLLNGDGADEIFAGYREQHLSYICDLLARGRFSKGIRELKALAKTTKTKPFNVFLNAGTSCLYKNKLFRLLFWNKYGVFRQRFTCFREKFHNNLFLDELISNIKFSALREYLTYNDKTAMRFSLEARVPFLDYRLVESGISLDDEKKIKDASTKYILREIAKDFTPPEIYDRPDKKGFYAPLHEWMKQGFQESLDQAFGEIKDNGLFSFIDSQNVTKQYQRFKNGESCDHSFIWRVYCLKKWKDVWDVRDHAAD